MTNREKKEGFTLIEILVALAITSLLSLILYTSFSGITRSSGALEDYSENYRQIVLVMNQMSNDLTGAFFSSALPYSSFSLTERDMGGDTFSELSFSCFSHQFIEVKGPGTDIITVTYKPDMDEEGNVSIIREIEPNRNIPSFDETMEEAVLTGVSSFSLSAVIGEDEEMDEWDSQSKLKLPDKIRLSVQFPGGQRLEKEYSIPLTGDVNRFGNSGKRSE